jgi:predicted patatin/cPLA2 family phospholipase
LLSCEYGLALATFLSDHHFSHILGSSAGAINSLYFVSKALDLGPGVYTDNATDPHCTNPWNFPNVLNVDWLVDNWLFGPKRFDFSLIQNSPSKVLMVLTRLADGKPVYFDARATDIATLRKAMKATSYAPLLTTGTQIIDGVAYGDGAIGDAIPYWKAISMGATHVVCLVTRTPDYRKHLSKPERLLHALRLLAHTKSYRTSYFRRQDTYNSVLDTIYSGAPDAVPVMVIHPASTEEIPSSIETRPAVLRQLGKQAFERADQQLTLLTR